MLYEIPGYGRDSTTPPGQWTDPLIQPLFLAKGPGGEVIVRDHSKHRLVVFSGDGDRLEYSRHMCGEGNGYGKFKDITGIAASKDHLYVADAQLSSIQKLQLEDGTWVKTISSSDTEDGKFNPFGLALDEAKSRLYVCDSDNHRIQVIDCKDNCDKLFVQSFESKGLLGGIVSSPKDIALDPNNDHLFITDYEAGGVQIFKTDGSCDRVFAYISFPFGIFYSHLHSTILVSSIDSKDDCVFMFSDDDVSRVYTPEGFKTPCGVIMLDNKQIVVANHNGNSLTVV